MKLNEKQTSKVEEFQFRVIPKRSTWQAFKIVLYNPSERTILKRTPKSWAQLLIFYSIFWSCLAVLFAICMLGLQSTLDDKTPSYILSESRIGTNPGLGFRPMPGDADEGSLIWYNLQNTTTQQKWISLIDKFLQPYEVNQAEKNVQDCDYTTSLEEGNVCKFPLDQLGPCSRKYNYGYNSASPCIFIKLNKIYGWKPDYYTNATKDMPQDLAKLIANSSNKGVWISCSGDKSLDVENIQGFKYYPNPILPLYYFPYTNNDNYLTPLVAVQVVNITTTVVVNIECRAWAHNIRYHGGSADRAGSVRFEVLVDP